MGTVSNLLSGTTQTFIGGKGTWTVNSPHTINDTKSFIKFSDLGSLLITAGNSSTITLDSTAFSVGSESGWGPKFHAWFYLPVASIVTMQVGTFGTPVTSSTSILPNTWTLCVVEDVPVAEYTNLDCIVTISGMTTGQIGYMTNPVVYFHDAISRNLFAAETWARLPQHMRESDEVQSNPDYPLLRFMDALLTTHDQINEIFDTYRYIPPEEGGDDEALSLIEPSVAGFDILKWLALLLGITIFNPYTGATSWLSLQTGLDVNSDSVASWTEWETTADGVDVGTAVSWDEIEAFDVGSSGFLNLLRWEVETAYYGIHGGTKQALIACVQKLLTGTQYVEFVNFANGDPWQIEIRTLFGEDLDDTAIGAQNQSILDIVANATPAGFKFIHRTIGSLATEATEELITEDGFGLIV